MNLFIAQMEQLEKLTKESFLDNADEASQYDRENPPQCPKCGEEKQPYEGETEGVCYRCG